MSLYTKQNPKTIEKLFCSIAPQYDRANALMSFNLHKWWNKTLVDTILSHKTPETYLDLCSGTGEIAFRLLREVRQPCEAHLLDFSAGMLACAKDKAGKMKLEQKHVLHFHHADAQSIPVPDNSMEAVTIAYGIRNVSDPEKCIKEVFRVLKPGGVFAILELTRPKNPILKLGHKFYTKAVLPIIGKCVASNQEAYEYLCSSIQSFSSPVELDRILRKSGFKESAVQPLTGGVCTIISGCKGKKV